MNNSSDENRLHVGTSGYRYWPGDIFPPGTTADQALRLYASALSSLELNRTFYQLPRETSIDKWHTLVPQEFVWAVKISKRLSHEKALVDVEEGWGIFLRRLQSLVTPKGIFLLQLPKKFPHDLGRLEAFFTLLPQGVRLAVEFRQEAWFAQDTYRMLEKHGVALVGVSAPGVPCLADIRTAPFVYYRLHGPRVWYKDRYTLAELDLFIQAGRQAVRQGDVYTYFDNTIGGHAYWNALEFRQKILE